MSDRLTIAAEPRTVIGKKVKQLRKDGIIPAVIYGRNEPESIQLERKLLRRVLRQASTTQLVDVTLDGKTRTVLARDIQQHVTRGDLLHVDFYEVDLKSTVQADVTLVLANVKQSSDGVVVLDSQTITIECLPGDLISEIEVDVSGIASADDVIHASDLTLPEGIEIVSDPETVIARFEFTRTEEAEEAEESAFASVESVGVVGEEEDEDEE